MLALTPGQVFILTLIIGAFVLLFLMSLVTASNEQIRRQSQQDLLREIRRQDRGGSTRHETTNNSGDNPQEGK